jgi:hypothetical protein
MGRFNINNFYSNSVSNDAREAVKEWSLKGYDETESVQHCELCGTRIKNYFMIFNRVTNATLLIGVFCYRSMLNYFEKNQIKTTLETENQYQDRAKKELNRFLDNKYENIIDPGHWIKWTINKLKEAPPDVQKAIRILKRMGYVDNETDRQILIEFHDNNRKYSRDILIPNWRNYKLPPPEYLTISESKFYLKQCEIDTGHSYERLINKIEKLSEKKFELTENEKKAIHEKNKRKVEKWKMKLVAEIKGKQINIRQAKDTIKRSKLSFNKWLFSFGQAKELIKQCGYPGVVQKYNKVIKNIDTERVLPENIKRNDYQKIKKYYIQKAKEEIENILTDYLTKIFDEAEMENLEMRLKKLNVKKFEESQLQNKLVID